MNEMTLDEVISHIVMNSIDPITKNIDAKILTKLFNQIIGGEK
jgi:hypothetical protein